MTSLSIPLDASIRQFARAVSADRLAGDEIVNAVLSGAHRPGETPDRIEAFRQFFERWRALLASVSAPRPFSSAALVKGVGALPSERRLVVLLTDICEFARAEVERILAPLSADYAALLSEGRAEIRARRYARSALIVEDEPLIAADLRDIVEGMGLRVIATARTAEIASRSAESEAPDIVLADYNLDGAKTGVDAVLSIQERHDCPIIFITGYPDQVLSGRTVEPDFVIVKPYRPEAVRAAIGQCLDAHRIRVSSEEAPARSLQ